MPATENIGYTGKSQLMDNYGWVQNTSNLSTVRDTVDLVPSDGIDHNSLMRMIYLFRQEKGDLKKKWEWDARCRIKAICATGMVELDRSIAGYRLTPLGEELKQSPHSTTFFRGKRVLSSEEKEIFKKGLLTNPPVIRVLAVLNDSRRNGNVPLSGDLTFEASKEEYASALEFVNFMRSTYNLNDNCYSICPGNHDLKFSEKPYSEDDKVTIAYDSSKEAYIDFYRQVFGADPTESLYSIRRFLTPDLVPIEVIAINSCLLQQDKDHFRGMGYVGNDQRDEIEGKLALTKGKKVFRILVMHHHLMPVMFSEEPKVSEMYSLTLDSEAISQFVLRNGINVVLHGHAHKEFYSEIVRISKEGSRKKYHVIGIGSAGATAADLSDGRKNMFGLLTFSKDSLCVTEYTLDVNANIKVSHLVEKRS